MPRRLSNARLSPLPWYNACFPSTGALHTCHTRQIKRRRQLIASGEALRIGAVMNLKQVVTSSMSSDRGLGLRPSIDAALFSMHRLFHLSWIANHHRDRSFIRHCFLWLFLSAAPCFVLWRASRVKLWGVVGLPPDCCMPPVPITGSRNLLLALSLLVPASDGSGPAAIAVPGLHHPPETKCSTQLLAAARPQGRRRAGGHNCHTKLYTMYMRMYIRATRRARLSRFSLHHALMVNQTASHARVHCMQSPPIIFTSSPSSCCLAPHAPRQPANGFLSFRRLSPSAVTLHKHGATVNSTGGLDRCMPPSMLRDYLCEAAGLMSDGTHCSRSKQCMVMHHALTAIHRPRPYTTWVHAARRKCCP